MKKAEELEKVVLITGASGGIGEATAMLLARKGMHVLLGARRIELLEAITAAIRAEGGSADYRRLDVTSLDDMQAFVEFALARFGRVDVLINCAAVMALSKLEALRIDEWNRIIDVNIRGVLHGIAAALPLMHAQRSGQFVNVASTGAHAVRPSAAVFCASKAAIVAISDGLRQEVGAGIRVTVVSPAAAIPPALGSNVDATVRERRRGVRAVPIGPEAVAGAIHFAIAQPAGVDVSEVVVRPTATA
jgi:NADP-dependent 3-hydroxy acid dehydrogenase YdfG